MWNILGSAVDADIEAGHFVRAQFLLNHAASGVDERSDINLKFLLNYKQGSLSIAAGNIGFGVDMLKSAVAYEGVDEALLLRGQMDLAYAMYDARDGSLSRFARSVLSGYDFYSLINPIGGDVAEVYLLIAAGETMNGDTEKACRYWGRIRGNGESFTAARKERARKLFSRLSEKLDGGTCREYIK